MLGALHELIVLSNVSMYDLYICMWFDWQCVRHQSSVPVFATVVSSDQEITPMNTMNMDTTCVGNVQPNTTM